MCRTLRPFSSLVVLLLASSLVTAQDTPAFMRAHRNNSKHRVQVERLETQTRVQEEATQPYQERVVLRRRGRKGVRPKKVYAPARSTPTVQVYREMRRSIRSTREKKQKTID